MNTSLIDQINQVLPEKYRSAALSIVGASMVLGRAIHAIRTGGGLKAILSSIWLGTNTPKAPLS